MPKTRREAVVVRLRRRFRFTAAHAKNIYFAAAEIERLLLIVLLVIACGFRSASFRCVTFESEPDLMMPNAMNSGDVFRTRERR